ncbi:MAG: hypothetical protein WCB49_11890, partial [Gammaproteobacteria bacterium]
MTSFRKLTVIAALIGSLASVAQGQTITGSFTVDNAYSVWIGTATAVTTNVIAPQSNATAQDIRDGEKFKFEYVPACNIYIVTWSDINIAQGMVASFTGGLTLKTGDPQIVVAPSRAPRVGTNANPITPAYSLNSPPTMAQINAVIAANVWFTPFAGATAAGSQADPHFNIYAPLVVPGLDPNAKWVWYNSGIDPNPVWPAPPYVPFTANEPGQLRIDHGEFLVWRIPCDGLVPKQTLTIKKTVVGPGAAFNFATTGTGLSNFTLTPGSDSTTSTTFNTLNSGTYTVTETPVAGYTLTSLTCTGDSDHGNVVNQAGGVASIDLDEGEHQTCTFVNTFTPPPELTGCFKDSNIAVTCNPDGTYTVTLSGSGFAGTDITMSSETSGVTVSPPQQPWAATTTWTVSGATPGQTVKLFVNGTKVGGGSKPDTDQCCSGEIKIVMPDCPPPHGELIVKKHAIFNV